MPRLILLLASFMFFHSLTAQNVAKLTLPTVLDSIEKIMEDNHIPGLLLTMATKDSVLYAAGLGMANLEQERKVNGIQLFRMGSITKTFASLAMLKLEGAGHFSLMDNLRDVAPEVPFKNKWSATHPVKIIHLLEHTAGFDDMHFKAIYHKGKKELPTKDMVQLHKESLISRWYPGTRMAYSNSGYVVLGYLIEKFSGQSYHDYIKKEIFDPIGMAHSNMASFPNPKEKFAQGYSYEGKQFSLIPFYAIHGGIAGTLNSCGEDMAKYIQFFLQDGMVDSNIVIPKAWIKRMETPTTSLSAEKGRKMGYALANATSQLGERFPFQGHNGGIDGFSSMFCYNRDLGVGFAVSNNANGDMDAIGHLIIEFLTQDYSPSKPQTVALDRAFVAPFLGFYQQRNPRNQIIFPITKFTDGFELKIINDTLYTHSLGGEPHAILSVGGNQFKTEEDNLATAILTETEKGQKVYIGRNYYEKESLVGIWLQRIWFFGSLLFSLTFILFGFVWLLINFFTKMKSNAVRSIGSLFIGILGLVMGMTGFIFAVEDLPNSGGMNWKTLTCFLGTMVFAFGSIIGAILLLKDFSIIGSKFLKYYLILVVFSLVSLTVYFAMNDFIGLKLWSY